MTFCFGDRDMIRKPRGGEWTVDQIAQLRVFAKSGISIPEAASLIGRSEMSLKNKMRKMSIRWITYGKKWSNSEIVRLSRYAAQGMTSAEIGKKLGRSARSVRNKASALKISLKKLGEHHHACKVSTAQVREMLQLKSKGMTHEEIAARFGISDCHVGHIVNLRLRFRETLQILNAKESFVAAMEDRRL